MGGEGGGCPPWGRWGGGVRKGGGGGRGVVLGVGGVIIKETVRDADVH